MTNNWKLLKNFNFLKCNRFVSKADWCESRVYKESASKAKRYINCIEIDKNASNNVYTFKSRMIYDTYPDLIISVLNAKEY